MVSSAHRGDFLLVGRDDGETANDLFLVVLILLALDEGGGIEASLIVALVHFGSEEVGRALLLRLCSSLLLLVLVI